MDTNEGKDACGASRLQAELERLPCPFCGQQPNHGWGADTDGNVSFFISCDNPRCGVMPGASGSNLREVMAVWNTRSNAIELTGDA